jgi:DNA-binding transcriptional MerR regulator
MRSAQAAAEAGVNVQTLRYYERRGLLPEPERLSSGYRAYGPAEVRVVRFVKRAQQLGFSLEEIESLLELAGGGPHSCDAARSLAADKVAQLEEKMASLTAMRDSLLQLVATCSLPPRERDCPLLDAIGHGDVSKVHTHAR